MSSLGNGGPPDYVPSPPKHVDVTYDDIEFDSAHKIGEGGSGVVYRTEVDHPQRIVPVAIKQPEFDGTITQSRYDRFIEEAEIWNQLTNSETTQKEGEITPLDHIVDLIDWGETPVPWLGLEFMDGGSLQQIFDDGSGRLPVDQALWLGESVCQAVWHAHRHGITHHDIKPANILFRETTRGWLFPKVSDWGLAKMMIDESEESDGLTPAYAAPEQFSSERFGAPDDTTDVYQIGVLTYEAITGRLPFEGTASEIHDAKVSENPTPPSEVIDLPEELATDIDEVLLSALNSSKTSRYDTIVYFRDELNGLYEKYNSVDLSQSPETHRSRQQDPPDAENQPDDASGASDETDVSTTATENISHSNNSWNVYSEDLEERKRQFTYRVLPGSLRLLFHQELVSEVETAEDRRHKTASEFEDLKNRARELDTFVEKVKLGDGVLGGRLTEDALERIDEVEDTYAQIGSLLDEQRKYLRNGEQSRLEDLHRKLGKHKEYLNAKRRHDRIIAKIESEMSEAEENISETIDEDELLSEDEEQTLTDELDKISRFVRQKKIEAPTDALTEQDLEQFDDLLTKERVLRERVNNHNQEVVQQRFTEYTEAASNLVDRTNNAIECYRDESRTIPEPAKEYLERVSFYIDLLEAFIQSEQSEYLSLSQKNRVNKIIESLKANREIFDAKTTFDEEMNNVWESIEKLDEITTPILSSDNYLEQSKLTAVQDDIESISTELDRIESSGVVDKLRASERERLESCQHNVSEIESAIHQHNSRVSRLRYHRKGGDAITTLIEVQEETTPCKKDGESLLRPGRAYTHHLARKEKLLAEFYDSKFAQHLPDPAVDRLTETYEQLREEIRFVEAKDEFEGRLQEVEPMFESLETHIKSILDMESYMTTPERESLDKQISVIENILADISSDGLLEPLYQPDIDRYDRYREKINQADKQVSEYNEEFIKSEEDTFDSVFSNLTSENLSLNKKQRLAIFRDEIHNRIIAGPGTGKTTSLACRIKYLIEKDIPTDDILALSFNRRAATQIENQLEELFNISDIDIRTLNSLGDRLIRENEPDKELFVGQTRLRAIGRIVRDVYTDDSTFTNHYDEFMELYNEENLSTDRKERKNLYDSVKYAKNKTLRGEEAAPDASQESSAHVRIADTLFKHGVEYRYKQAAYWQETTPVNEYIPDFTLPHEQICIEYLPPNEIRYEKYPSERKPEPSELQELYADTDWDVITIQADKTNDNIIDKILLNELNDTGVELEGPLNEDELIDAVYEHNITWREIEDKFAEFIKKAKTNQIDPSSRLDEIDEKEEPMVYHFSCIASTVLDQYREKYNQYEVYDYTDQILTALDIVESGKVGDEINYQHILIDEFQDLNFAQIQLIQAILDHCDDAHLFAVGDDWQSIYAFKGARPEYFANFEEHFSPAETTYLDINYRCPSGVVEASNELMATTTQQTSKSLRPGEMNADSDPIVHRIPGEEGYQYETNAIKALSELITEALEQPNRSPEDIMVIARNEVGSPYISRLTKKLQRSDIPVGGYNGVTLSTAHGAKGEEADHVIIANAVREQRDGFPATERDSGLMKVVDSTSESHMAEERRLFYVALTRPKKQVDIQTWYDNESQFIDPLTEHSRFVDPVIDCDEERISVTGVVKDTMEPYSARQIGEFKINGYEINYKIESDASEIPLFESGKKYEIENVGIGEYKGDIQLVIDSDSTVVRRRQHNR